MPKKEGGRPSNHWPHFTNSYFINSNPTIHLRYHSLLAILWFHSSFSIQFSVPKPSQKKKKNFASSFSLNLLFCLWFSQSSVSKSKKKIIVSSSILNLSFLSVIFVVFCILIQKQKTLLRLSSWISLSVCDFHNLLFLNPKKKKKQKLCFLIHLESLFFVCGFHNFLLLKPKKKKEKEKQLCFLFQLESLFCQYFHNLLFLNPKKKSDFLWFSFNFFFPQYCPL